MIEIPLTSDPEQLFSVSISGETYDLRVILNSRTGKWSISLSQEGQHIIDGVALVGGVDIFKQHNILIKNAYVVNLESSSKDPSRSGLGTTSKLFILDDEEVPNG